MPASGIGTEDIGTAAPWLSIKMPCSPGSSFIKAHGSSPSNRLQSPISPIDVCLTTPRNLGIDPRNHSDACGFAPQRKSSITITGKSTSFCSHASKASMNHRIWDEATSWLLAIMRRTLMAMMISAYPMGHQHTIGNIPHRAGTAPVFDAAISDYLRCNNVSHHPRKR